MHGLKRLFGRTHSIAPETPLLLFNTLTKSKEPFALLPHAREARMYNCGPTVYGTQHIGNLSMFVFTDILRRTLQYNGFGVKQVINFTDFGHLTSDADEGEDKMMKGLKREGLKPSLENMKKMGRMYADAFKADIAALNIDVGSIAFPFASEYVPAQIAMIQTLEEKGYAYRAKNGVYFDTARFPGYGKLGAIQMEGQRAGARVERDPEKRSPSDFLLWKSDAKKTGWESPWGLGFPGWHIECSAMINSILGKQIDIHTGGIEHIPVHHNNEIAQSEAATGKSPLARFWMHREHLRMADQKIAKSEGNTVVLSDIVSKGFHPLALRYLFLGSHYRTPANFSWEALESAQMSLLRLQRFVGAHDGDGTPIPEWQKKIRERLNDDLDTPGALALVWEMIKDPALSPADVRASVRDADKVFGLSLGSPDEKTAALSAKVFGVPVALETLPERIRDIVEAREAARNEKNWAQADQLRAELLKLNYAIEDTAEGPRIFRKE
ncbi:MAG: cysteine--tRNA ligase [Candidatus Kaiserbacteria bacterium]|nr:MAG: cysteine--tRNA ligase [Candidatus Kaiserbacteria bacterium]